MRCRHERNSWLMFGGMEWCYACGAIRRLRPVEGQNACAAVGRWTKPTGSRDKNPWEEYDKELRRWKP